MDTQLKEIIKILNNKNIEDRNMLNEIKSEIRKSTILLNPDLANLTRSNNLIISSESYPVFTQTNSIEFVERVSELGSLYSVTTGAVSVAASAFLVLQLTNPANSGKTFYINTVSGGSSVTTTMALYQNATFAAAGTPLTPLNLNWNFSNSSIATAKDLTQATDPTTGGTLISTLVQPAGVVNNLYYGSLIIPSGTSSREFYVRLTNAASVNNLSINVTWWEFQSNTI